MWDFITDSTSGVVGGITNCVSGYFLDTVKTRMQMDSEMTSMTHTLKHIIKNQGFAQLFSGMYYPLIYSTVGFSVVFSTYEFYRRLRSKQTYTTLDGIENGMVVGTIITFLSTPVQLVKCIMQADSLKRYKSSPDCLKSIFREKGIRGLYKGNMSLLFREVPGYAAQFAAYEWVKGYYVSKENPHLTFLQSAAVGVVSSVIGWIFSYPQDTIKTRIQVHPDGYFKNWRWCPDGGFVECGKEIFKASGWRGFFVGLSPCLIRAVYSDGISIVAYQKTRQLMWHCKNASVLQ